MFNKTRSLFFLTFMVILSLVLTACGASQPSTQVANTEESATTSKKSITLVIAEDPPSLSHSFGCARTTSPPHGSGCGYDR